MTTTSEADRLRREIRDLTAAVGRGDVPERKFNADFVRRAVDLYRAVIAERLAPDESILEEHHVVRAHMKLNQSVLRETTQEAISLFLTDRRLFRLRQHFTPTQPITADEQDGTEVDEIACRAIERIGVRRQVRSGEVIAGLVIMVVALVFREALLVTGPLLVALGVLGVLHGVLWPTRWVEVVSERRPGAPIEIPAARKKSARRLIRRLRAQQAAAATRAGVEEDSPLAPRSLEG